MSLNNKIQHLFLNSNPWFSAVTDYSLQLALYLSQQGYILYCSEVGSTAMDQKCQEYKIPFANVPIHNQSIFNFLKSFIFLHNQLIKNKKSLKYIWVFEGREHSLCALSKILFPFLWKNKILIRVRGQAQGIRSNLFSKLLYNKITNKIIFAADCVKNRIMFDIPQDKTMIQYYSKDFSKNIVSNERKSEEILIDSSFPSIKSDNLLYLVIGRFDKVKGHDYLIDAFLQADLNNKEGNKIKSQLVFLGYNANLSAEMLYDKYFERFGDGKCIKNKYYLKSDKLNKELFIVSEKIPNIDKIISMVHFGIIPSLDSEVICRVGVEFLQCGTPVISSNAGALPEVFSDFKELIFPVGDTKLLRHRLESSSKIYLDKEDYFEKRKKAKRIGVEKFSLKNYDNLFDFVNRN
ncbi:glycosyltransferase [Fluviispira sanaruensis]|uniref:Group 1 glycosyl transferase n=1 Tax=Fluviispira sanaruensis TaxID=2493639 RepID=A0A4P2VNC1_FLUSA|nr:glycosyltransferase [Fluviispira sanaruensis]BBH54581.1 group 1 glycosyl transferase [Fluviispira sanaruensis]